MKLDNLRTSLLKAVVLIHNNENNVHQYVQQLQIDSDVINTLESNMNQLHIYGNK